MTSPDGITWTAQTAADGEQLDLRHLRQRPVRRGGADGTHRVMTSPDGITWTRADGGGGESAGHAVTYGNGLFVAVANSGTHRGDDLARRHHLDGADGGRGELIGCSVTYGNGLFVAVAVRPARIV